MLTTSSMACNTLFVDIGNTSISIKCGTHYIAERAVDFSASNVPEYDKAIISCVGDAHLLEQFSNYKVVSPSNYPGITFKYSLSQLGVDRFLAIVAAFEAFKTHSNTDVMIIDIGTCITIDYVVDNVHYSGGIAPGIHLMQQSFNFKGEDSINAWHRGISNMTTAYLHDKINAFSGNVLLTGGGQNIIQISDSRVSYHQNLVISGLEIIANQQSLTE